MSEDEIKRKVACVANSDTPSAVIVPETWPALVSWVIGRFGIGVIGFGLLYVIYTDFMEVHKSFYEDIKSRDERIVSSFEKSNTVQIEFAATLRETRSILESHAKILERLERGMIRNSQ